MELEGNEKILKNISKGIGISLIASVIMLFVFAVVLTYTNVSEEAINPVIIVITGISIFIGSSIGNSKIKKNGLINGGAIGGIYLILLYIISSIIGGEFSLSKGAIIFILVGIIFGVLGGIIGVNKK